MTRCLCRFGPLLASAVPMLIVFATAAPARAQGYRTVEDGPVHEAYAQPVTGVVSLEPVPHAPPAPIVERIPAKCGPDVEWIGGYWHWDDDQDDWFWIGGCWRKPPPNNKYWIQGLWKEYPEGWVWIRGFWSPVPEERLEYIDEAPPDPEEEDVGFAPRRNTFHMNGYWNYHLGRYRWLSGQWLDLDPNYVLVPAHFLWRPGGYVAIAPFWDHDISKRGCTYACVYVEPARRVEFVYEPVVIIEPEIVVRRCFVYYPDYVYLIHHHHHHHSVWWDSWCESPSWFYWDSWWSMSWHHHWGVWWWYSHPGYPHPHWMSASYASRIAPPGNHLTVIFNKTKIKAPTIVKNYGVVAPSQTLAAVGKVKGKEHEKLSGKIAPVISKKDQEKLDKEHEKDVKHVEVLKPTGKHDDKEPHKVDPKDHPSKPVITELGKKGGGKGDDHLKDKDKKPPIGAVGGAGDPKGKDKVKDDGGGKPPISRLKTDEDKSKGKDKMKDDGGGKPPIGKLGGQGSNDPKKKDADHDKDKDKGKPGDSKPPFGKQGDDPKGKDRDKDKDKGKSGDNKSPFSNPGGGKTQLDDKPKERDRDNKPGDNKPPHNQGDDSKSKVKEKMKDDKPGGGGGSKPSGGGAGGGDSDKKGKDKDKRDKDKDKDKP